MRDLQANFDNFIPIFWQSTSGYVGMPSPNYSTRGGMYGVGGIPHARFGGYISEVGGISGGSMYNYYLPHYNTLNALDSPCAIDITMDVTSKSTIDVQADVELTGNITTTNNKIILLLTYKYTDDYTCAVVAYHDENFNLTTVGQTGSFSYSFTYDPDWVLPDLKAVAIVQTFSSNYKIHQAATCGVSGIFSIFSSNIQSGPPQLGVQFYNESYPDTGIVSYEWDFDGDGTWDSTEENPYHLYDTIGTYDVSLRISDGVETATATAEDYITVTSTADISGELSGIWTSAYSPYIITDDAHLADENMLEIEPNVEVHTNNGSKITIEGYFSAIGNDRGNIIFTTDNTWSGLYFFNNDYENALGYSQITGSVDCAVDIYNARVVVGHNTIYENSTTSQKGPAINVRNSDDVLIEWNLISNNTSSSLCGAISLDDSSPVIARNIIVNNEAMFAGAFSMKNESCPEITHNTVANNLSNYTFYLFSSSNPIIDNSIFRQTGDVFINFSSNPVVTYSDLSGGYAGTGNISDDPLFVDPTTGDGPSFNGLEADWSLQETSPCIDAGDPTSPLDPDGTRADMGALYYHQNISIDDPELPEMTMRSYPNPFTDETTISFSSKSHIQELEDVTIYNIKGEVVKTLELEPSVTGYNTIWDGKDNSGKSVSNGIYFYTIKTDNIETTQKLILMR
ncbi:MAG: T9SS type A sorting domain-containing protein [Candidatus Cloacimonetes bacterium]|nr:T9SS type A sorting domain-containing protein [Candidatus Cloacimonadota bacterium]